MRDMFTIVWQWRRHRVVVRTRLESALRFDPRAHAAPRRRSPPPLGPVIFSAAAGVQKTSPRRVLTVTLSFSRTFNPLPFTQPTAAPLTPFSHGQRTDSCREREGDRNSTRPKRGSPGAPPAPLFLRLDDELSKNLRSRVRPARFGDRTPRASAPKSTAKRPPVTASPPPPLSPSLSAFTHPPPSRSVKTKTTVPTRRWRATSCLWRSSPRWPSGPPVSVLPLVF